VGYSPERKTVVLKLMLPPNTMAIRQLSKAEGIAEATLHKWRSDARSKGQLLPDADAGSEGWSSRDKFAAVLETATLNEADLAEYCRKRALYPVQIKAWRVACEQANDWDRSSTARISQATQEEKKRIKDLERELARKDRALAETAALLVVRKKASAIWGGEKRSCDAGSDRPGDGLKRRTRTHDQHPTSPNRHAADRRGRHRRRAARQGLLRAGDQRPHSAALDERRPASRRSTAPGAAPGTREQAERCRTRGGAGSL